MCGESDRTPVEQTVYRRCRMGCEVYGQGCEGDKGDKGRDEDCDEVGHGGLGTVVAVAVAVVVRSMSYAMQCGMGWTRGDEEGPIIGRLTLPCLESK